MPQQNQDGYDCAQENEFGLAPVEISCKTFKLSQQVLERKRQFQ